MIFVATFLAAAGLLMLLKPQWVWSISESWKSSDATGPSPFYIKSIRFGGILCTLAGIAGGVAYLMA